jgi:hydrogenase expression/formation protein HypE
MNNEKITLGHGSGGELSHKLISEIISDILNVEKEFGLNDAALLDLPSTRMAISTDSYIIDPIFFPGGDIGKLAVCGTMNDLLMSGAKPLFMSLALIIEEGFNISDLRKILLSIRDTTKETGVHVAAGDTKVLPSGKGSGIFINTTGIGVRISKNDLLPENIKEGDSIILTGTLGDHSAAVMIAREGLATKSEIKSDCTQLSQPVLALLEAGLEIRCMRDPTRGGLAAVLSEISRACNLAMYIEETSIPKNKEVEAICEILGIDPLFMANEGKAVIFCSPNDSEKIITILKRFNITERAAVIGEARIGSGESKASIVLKTITGGDRIVTLPLTEQLPRIC